MQKEIQPNTSQEYQSLDNIVLCLSGGGYRAALFHLGAMSYLERLNLLNNVRILSTVSGGSFPGMLYALYKSINLPFSEVYNDLIAFTRNNTLIEETLEKLTSSSEKQDLILLFADFYHKNLLQQAKFEELWKLTPQGENDKFLRNVIFNAIELVNGLAFRFHYQGKYVGDPLSYSGNNYLRIPEEKVKQVRLADILAASSGFPGGFEPLLIDRELMEIEVLHPQVQHEVVVGLMDGGIIDNQGLDAAFRAVVRDEFPEKYSAFNQMDNTEFAESIVDLINDQNSSKNKKQRENFFIEAKEAQSKIIDKYTYIISDVDSYYLRPFRNADYNKKFFTNLNFNWIFILFHVFIITILGLSVKTFSSLDWQESFTFSTIFTLGVVVVLLLFNQLVIRKLFKKVPVVGAKAWPMLRSMPLFKILYLIRQRIFSLTTVVGGVFLKEIRRNVYKQLFGKERFKHRRISNLITDLIQKDVTRRQKELEKENIGSHPVFQKIYNPSESIISTATRAFNTGTTFWFDKEELNNNKIEDLVSAGQFTMCFNLLEHLCRQFPEVDDTHQFFHILSIARKDWDHFNEDPTFLFNDLKSDSAEPVA
ncbi:hypothetical protein BH23BAC1_BH23BAC1_30530 [soil metagenome]